MKTKKNTTPKLFLKKTNGMPIGREFLVSLRENLVLHMKINPPVAVEAPLLVRSPFHYAMALAFAVLFLIFTAGGTSIASQNSLPGDFLYPVKILSERISVAASFTPESRSRTRLFIASERVHEAALLTQINSNEPIKNSAQFHAAMQSVMDNFNTQISTTLTEESNLKEKNDSAGALKIANNIQDATSSFKNILTDAKEQGGNGETDDVDRFINSNNDFNTRAEIESKDSNNKKDTPQNVPALQSNGNDSGEGHKSKGKSNDKSNNQDEQKSTSQMPIPTFPSSILAAPLFAPVSDKTVPNNPDNGSQDRHMNENSGDNKSISSPSVLSSPTPADSTNTSGASSPAEQKKSDSGNGGDSQKKDGGNKKDGENSAH